MRCALGSLRELSTAVPGIQLMIKEEMRTVSGSHKQRAAHAVVHAARQDGYERIAVGTCGNYGLAVAVEAAHAGMSPVVVVPQNWASAPVDQQLRGLAADIRWVCGGYEDAVASSKIIAVNEHIADGNVDGPYSDAVSRTLARIAVEIVAELCGTPDVVWVPLGNGTTTAAIGAALADESGNTTVVGVTSWGNNSILASWPRRTHRALPAGRVNVTALCEPLVNLEALHGQQALDVLHAGAGQVVGVRDDDLVAASDLLADYGVLASPAGSAGIAGLITHADRLGIGGTHVAIVTGRG